MFPCVRRRKEENGGGEASRASVAAGMEGEGIREELGGAEEQREGELGLR